MLHVVPVADIREHVICGIGCWCRPRVELIDADDENALVIHHALDGREHFEPDGDAGMETVQ